MNQSHDQNAFEVSCHIFGAMHSVIIKFPIEGLVINHILAIVFNIFLILPTISLNGVAVVTILKSYQLKRKPCYFIILVQSVSDLAVGLLGIPFFVYFLSTGIGLGSNCVLAIMALRSTIIPMGISTFTLFIMTMERYMAILHPYAYSTQVTKKRLLTFAGISVAVQFTTSILSLAFHGFYEVYRMITVSIVFSFVAFAYSKIFLVIRKLSRSEKNPRDVTSEDNMARKKLFLREMKQAKSCFIVTICFFVLAFLPTAIAVLASLNLDKFERLANLIWGVTLSSCNSSFNSIIFYWSQTLLRKETFKTLKTIWLFF